MRDLIKRSDAIEAVRKSKWWHFCDLIPLLSAIKDIPSADRPRGEWIDQHENGHGFWVGTCNQCGKENRVNNFCPYCGARMKGADDE
jgi:hypothetical protein